MRVFELAGKRYAPNAKELVNSLFVSGGTFDGTYKALKTGVRLYKGNGELFAFIVNNSRGEQFAVSAGVTKEGKPFYMYGLNSRDREYLNLPIYGPDEREAIALAFSKFNA